MVSRSQARTRSTSQAPDRALAWRIWYNRPRPRVRRGPRSADGEARVALSEFRVPDSYRYSYRSPVRWLLSHLRRYPAFPLVAVVGVVGAMRQSTSAHTRLNSRWNFRRSRWALI